MRMPCLQESATFWHFVEALALGKPLEDVGGLMASLDPYHLGLALAVLRHAGCGSASRRISSTGVAAEHL
jgi:hypothetical protein